MNPSELPATPSPVHQNSYKPTRLNYLAIILILALVAGFLTNSANLIGFPLMIFTLFGFFQIVKLGGRVKTNNPLLKTFVKIVLILGAVFFVIIAMISILMILLATGAIDLQFG